jgi:UDP-2,3-diacylglucosamine pyrophosphatase LpxH
MPGKDIFLSDIHMGGGQPLDSDAHPYDWCTSRMSEVCANFMDVLAADPAVTKVILLGDIMDTNVCPVDCAPPSYRDILQAAKHARLVASLKNLSRDKPVYLVRGNHDLDYAAADIAKTFPDILFIPSNVYEDGILVATHGHAYDVWCAPDTRKENLFKPLPIGYFLSRIGATRTTRTGGDNLTLLQIVKLIGAILGKIFSDPGHKKLVEKMIRQVSDWATMDRKKETILMPNGDRVPLPDIADNYKRLPEIWGDLYPNTSWQSYMLAWQDMFFDERLPQGKKIFIAGHSHEETPIAGSGAATPPILSKARGTRREADISSG